MLSDVVQVLFSCPKTTPLNKPLPPVVATATNCIQRLHGCNRVFQHWRLYYQRQSERAHEWSKWQTTRRLFNWWKNLTVLRKQLQCVVGYCSEKEREADRLSRGQLLCSAWSVWRCALVRERVSVWGLCASKRLLLSQVFTAWQSMVQKLTD